MFLLQQPWLPSGHDPADEKERLRISDPKRLQSIVATEKVEVDLVPGQFRIELQPGLQQFRGQHPLRRGSERSGEGLQLINRDSDPCGHSVAAKLQKVFATLLQGFHHRKSGNAPATPLAFTAIVKPDN